MVNLLAIWKVITGFCSSTATGKNDNQGGLIYTLQHFFIFQRK